MCRPADCPPYDEPIKELAEVWCEKDANPADHVVETSTGKHFLCTQHASLLEFAINSRNFNGGMHQR